MPVDPAHGIAQPVADRALGATVQAVERSIGPRDAGGIRAHAAPCFGGFGTRVGRPNCRSSRIGVRSVLTSGSRMYFISASLCWGAAARYRSSNCFTIRSANASRSGLTDAFLIFCSMCVLKAPATTAEAFSLVFGSVSGADSRQPWHAWRLPDRCSAPARPQG